MGETVDLLEQLRDKFNVFRDLTSGEIEGEYPDRHMAISLLASYYARMYDEGGIRLHPGHVPAVDEMLAEALEQYGTPSVIVCDRWRLGELTDALIKIGANVPIVTRGQGFKDGAEDVRAFRKAVLSGDVSVPRALTWRVTMAGSRVETDAAGNAKLSKKSQRARDDLAAAAIIAVAEGYRQANKPALKPAKVQWA